MLVRRLPGHGAEDGLAAREGMLHQGPFGARHLAFARNLQDMDKGQAEANSGEVKPQGIEAAMSHGDGSRYTSSFECDLAKPDPEANISQLRAIQCR